MLANPKSWTKIFKLACVSWGRLGQFYIFGGWAQIAKLELASAYEQRCRALEESLEQKIAESSGLHIQIADLLQQLDAIGKQHNQSQIELAALQAQLETHKSLSAELQSLFTEHGRLPNL